MKLLLAPLLFPLLLASLPAGAQQAAIPPAKVYKYVAHMPVFKPGDANRWVATHASAPKEATIDNLTRKSVVQFTVNEDGHVSDVAIIKPSNNQVLDSAAIACVAAMPAWQPGYDQGKPVKVALSIAVPWNAETVRK